MLLQELPASEQVNEDARENAWQHVSQLASTLSREELLQLDFATLLHRLYHQDPLRLFEAKSWAFKCSCNRNKTLDALLTVGRSGLEETLNEEGQILITCEFCHQQYRYDDADIKQLFEQSIH
jgi:molecular chaperone Hsp33